LQNGCGWTPIELREHFYRIHLASNFSVNLIVLWSVVDRQLLSFLCFAKEKTAKERRPRCHWSSASQLCGTKNGKALKLATLKQEGFLYPFFVPRNWQCQKWMKVKSNGKTDTFDGNMFPINC
jgi:hypothetical protein